MVAPPYRESPSSFYNELPVFVVPDRDRSVPEGAYRESSSSWSKSPGIGLSMRLSPPQFPLRWISTVVSLRLPGSHSYGPPFGAMGTADTGPAAQTRLKKLEPVGIA
jgi:hypothetical protein